MTFPPDVVAAVLRHMNTDHADDCVVICRGLGAQPATTRAVMSDVDADAAYFEATIDDRVVPVRIPFRQRLTERPQIRVEVTWMYHESCDRPGIPPERRTNEAAPTRPAQAADPTADEGAPA